MALPAKKRNRAKDELDNLVGELTRIRDELRVKLHLAGMELKDRYSKVDAELFEMEQRVKQATEESAHEVKDRLRQLKTKLDGLRDRFAAL